MKKMIKPFFTKVAEEFADIRFASASLAFSTLFALIPFLIVILAFFKYVGGLEKLYPQVEAMLLSYMKEATGNTVTQYLKTTLGQVRARTLGVSGILLLAVSTFGLLRSIDIAFHKIWKIKITRPYYQRMWLYSLFLLTTPVFLAAFIGLKTMDLSASLHQSIEQQFLFICAWIFVLTTIYKVIPSTNVSLWGSLLSATLTSFSLYIVQSSFFWVSFKLFKQNKLYGSIASFPIFLLWLLTVWYVILTGVSLCAFLQQKVFKRT